MSFFHSWVFFRKSQNLEFPIPMLLYIYINQVFAPVVGSAGQTSAAKMSLTSPPVILGGGGTNPVMVASNDIGQGAVDVLGDPVAYKISLSIVSNQFSQLATTISAPITSCRLYSHCYTMSPIAEQSYLSLTPTMYKFSNIHSMELEQVIAGTITGATCYC